MSAPIYQGQSPPARPPQQRGLFAVSCRGSCVALLRAARPRARASEPRIRPTVNTPRRPAHAEATAALAPTSPGGGFFLRRSDGTRAFYFTEGHLRALFEAAGLRCTAVVVHERDIQNRAKGLKMDRRWIQATFELAAGAAAAGGGGQGAGGGEAAAAGEKGPEGERWVTEAEGVRAVGGDLAWCFTEQDAARRDVAVPLGSRAARSPLRMPLFPTPDSISPLPSPASPPGSPRFPISNAPPILTSCPYPSNICPIFARVRSRCPSAGGHRVRRRPRAPAH